MFLDFFIYFMRSVFQNVQAEVRRPARVGRLEASRLNQWIDRCLCNIIALSDILLPKVVSE